MVGNTVGTFTNNKDSSYQINRFWCEVWCEIHAVELQSIHHKSSLRCSVSVYHQLDRWLHAHAFPKCRNKQINPIILPKLNQVDFEIVTTLFLELLCYGDLDHGTKLN